MHINTSVTSVKFIFDRYLLLLSFCYKANTITSILSFINYFTMIFNTYPCQENIFIYFNILFTKIILHKTIP